LTGLLTFAPLARWLETLVYTLLSRYTIANQIESEALRSKVHLEACPNREEAENEKSCQATNVVRAGESANGRWDNEFRKNFSLWKTGRLSYADLAACSSMEACIVSRSEYPSTLDAKSRADIDDGEKVST
jgi:hypothetical protein